VSRQAVHQRMCSGRDPVGENGSPRAHRPGSHPETTVWPRGEEAESVWTAPGVP
jgi:hypothetical protein